MPRHAGQATLSYGWYTHVLMHENIVLYTKLGWREYGRGEQSGFQARVHAQVGVSTVNVRISLDSSHARARSSVPRIVQ